MLGFVDSNISMSNHPVSLLLITGNKFIHVLNVCKQIHDVLLVHGQHKPEGERKRVSISDVRGGRGILPMLPVNLMKYPPPWESVCHYSPQLHKMIVHI